MNALPIARLFGFEIRVHVSWAIILAVIGVTAATQATLIAPEIGTTGGWVVGSVVAAAFLVLGTRPRAWARARGPHVGLPGGPVIVYFFGGAATSRLETTRPRDEVLVAVAGPIVSLVAGAGLMADRPCRGARRRAGRSFVIGRVALVIGVMNLLLGGVNLLPAFPARWRPHRPRPGVGPNGRSVARPEHRGARPGAISGSCSRPPASSASSSSIRSTG